MKIDHVYAGENPPYDTSLLGQIPVFLNAVIRSASIGVLIMGDQTGTRRKISLRTGRRPASLLCQHRFVPQHSTGNA